MWNANDVVAVWRDEKTQEVGNVVLRNAARGKRSPIPRIFVPSKGWVSVCAKRPPLFENPTAADSGHHNALRWTPYQRISISHADMT